MNETGWMDGWMALLVRKRSSRMILTSPERNGFLTDGGLDSFPHNCFRK